MSAVSDPPNHQREGIDSHDVPEAEAQVCALAAGPAAAAVAAAQHEAASHNDAEEVRAQDEGDHGAAGQAGK